MNDEEGLRFITTIKVDVYIEDDRLEEIIAQKLSDSLESILHVRIKHE